jgi:drug/metabolite transporter (DMT)-like permease
MIYLILQVVFASSFTLFIKWAQIRRQENVITIGAINYIVAAVSIIPVFFFSNLSPVSFGALWTGGSMGAVYFIAFFFAIYSIRKVGASTTTVVSVLSILMPIAFAAIVWQEKPDLVQSVGIGMALLALTLIGAQKNPHPSDFETKSRWMVPLVLFSFFLLCGFSRLSQEAFKHVSSPEHRPTFILAAFTIAAIPSLIVLIYGRRMPTPMEWFIGFLMGISNNLQTYFVLLALHYFEGFIVFPVTSAGGIVLTTLVATSLLKEQLNKRTYVGIAIAVVSLFLLYWIP